MLCALALDACDRLCLKCEWVSERLLSLMQMQRTFFMSISLIHSFILWEFVYEYEEVFCRASFFRSSIFIVDWDGVIYIKHTNGNAFYFTRRECVSVSCKQYRDNIEWRLATDGLWMAIKMEMKQNIHRASHDPFAGWDIPRWYDEIQFNSNLSRKQKNWIGIWRMYRVNWYPNATHQFLERNTRNLPMGRDWCGKTWFTQKIIAHASTIASIERKVDERLQRMQKIWWWSGHSPLTRSTCPAFLINFNHSFGVLLSYALYAARCTTMMMMLILSIASSLENFVKLNFVYISRLTIN